MTYTILIGYNKKIATNSKELLYKLKINQIPILLFRKNYLYFNKGDIISNYKCSNIQSYFINPEFVYYNIPVKQKIEYLFMLSHRRVSEINNFIPKNYIKQNLLNNPLINSDLNYIYFIPEIAKQRKENTNVINSFMGRRKTSQNNRQKRNK